MATQRIIGIDFATSTTVIRIKTYINGVPESSPVFVESIKFDNDDTLPSLALRDDDYGYVFGKEASDLAGNGQGGLIRNFKMNLLSPDPEVRTETETLIGGFFRYIYEEGYALQRDHFTPCDEEITYISYPAKWDQDVADIMVRIVSEAGFQNVRGLDEASAAIHTVLVQKDEELKKLGDHEIYILMVDMGAGTTDLALCRRIYGEKSVEIISTYPDEKSEVFFGGREIDGALWHYIKTYLADCGLSLTMDEHTYLTQSKAWKERSVSRSLNKNQSITSCGFIQPMFTYLGGSPKPFPAIDRAKLEELLSEYLKQLPELIHGIIANTPNVNAEDIDLVILTGGHSQWYFAEDILAGRMPQLGSVNLPKIRNDPTRIIRLSRPQETVALGLVYQPISVAVARRTCPRCSATVQSGMTFCEKCGTKPTTAKPPKPCVKCGAGVAEGLKFCEKCGTPAEVPEKRNCEKCGMPLAAEMKFCEKCGTSVKQVQPPQAPPPAPSPVQTPGNLPRKVITTKEEAAKYGEYLKNMIAERTGAIRKAQYESLSCPSDLKFEKRMCNALTYAAPAPDEIPILVCDGTVFDGGRGRFLLTSSALHHRSGKGIRRCEWRAIAGMAFRHSELVGCQILELLTVDGKVTVAVPANMRFLFMQIWKDLGAGSR